MIYPQILNGKQAEILRNLGFLTDFGFYLAGGTALAIQLGHRTSLDFDFYSQEKLDTDKLRREFVRHFPDEKIPQEQPEDTFWLTISGINLSIFYYPYKLVKKLADYPPVKLASLEDIAAMKIAAVIQRARQRDFFDLYYLLKKLSLARVIEATYEKYPWYQENNQIIFKALTYFEEADEDTEIRRIAIFDKNLSWKKVKETIKKEVENYLRKF